jgi:hypothetical protein
MMGESIPTGLRMRLPGRVGFGAVDKELLELFDKEAIGETISRLFIGTDRRDWEAVKACLTDEVHFDMTSLAGGTPAILAAQAIVEMWEAGLRPLEAIHHQAGNLLTEVESDRATAFCYGIASHYLSNPSGANTRTFVGSYDFSLVRLEGRWRISAFKFNLKYIDGNKDLESGRKD